MYICVNTYIHTYTCTYVCIYICGCAFIKAALANSKLIRPRDRAQTCARAAEGPLQGRDVSPLCLVSVNVSMASQAWSCDTSPDEP